MQNQENKDMIYAGFFVRLTAFLVDTLIVFLVSLIIRLPMWIVSFSNPDNMLKKPLLFHFTFWDILLYILGVLYFVILTYKSGATIGKKAFCLKVTGIEEENLTFINVLYRETIGRYLSSAIMFIGYILIGADSQKRGLHDMLCDTRVVYNFSRPTDYRRSTMSREVRTEEVQTHENQVYNPEIELKEDVTIMEDKKILND